jgi:SPP1 family predicted phage head-tail adaptor
MKAPCVSDLTAYCRVQRLDTKSDGAGGQEAASYGNLWIDYFTFWAQLTWGAGGEREVMNRTQAYGTAKLVARFDPRLGTAMRIILDDGSILNVRSVDNRNQRYLWMDIDAEQGVGT